MTATPFAGELRNVSRRTPRAVDWTSAAEAARNSRRDRGVGISASYQKNSARRHEGHGGDSASSVFEVRVIRVIRGSICLNPDRRTYGASISSSSFLERAPGC